MRRAIVVAMAFAVTGAGCTDEAVRESPPPAPVVVQQPVLDDGPNWFVAGGSGLVELVGGTDGEPDQLTGRFALDGRPISDAASGPNGWVVVGEGLSQPLDADAVRQREARVALSGEAITFVEAASDGYVIGGAAGRFQRLDAQGEPTTAELEISNGATLTGAALNPLGTAWLVGADNGEVVIVNTSLDTPQTTPVAIDGGEPVVAVVEGPGTPAWFALTANSIVEVSALGTPGTPQPVAADITTAEVADGTIVVGTADGRIGVANHAASPSFSFSDLFGGAAVTEIVTNGTDWVALSDDGRARRFSSGGQPSGEAVQVSSDASRALVGAHWNAATSEWRLVVGEIGFVAFAAEDLTVPRELTPVLEGATIRAASPGYGEVLVAGDGGRVQILDDRGQPVSEVAEVSGAGDLLTAAFNGTDWLVGGTGGTVAVVSEDGAAGAAQTVFGGDDVHFAAWSGEYWLVGGEGGQIQLVRVDGSTSGEVRTIAEAAVLYDARWNGREWIAVGETTDGTGVAAIIVSDVSVAPIVTILDETGPLYAVDFNGIEWIAAGQGGLLQRINAQGEPVGAATDVLTGFDVRDVAFNGSSLIVAGDFGAIQRLSQDFLPIRAPISVIDRHTAHAIAWTSPRGFFSGPCLSNDACYRGPCVGGIAAGRCCDSACDRPCESCLEDDTGVEDGTCAPVVAGKQPPVKAGVTDACSRQSEGTCGFTGVCDGAGECEYYGGDILCAESVCTLGRYTPEAFCDGTGACSMASEVDCAPYKGCNDDGCLDTCTSDDDCIDGYACEESECVETEEDPQDPEDPDGDGGGGGDGDGGCCATTQPPGSGTVWAALFFAFAALVRTGRTRRALRTIPSGYTRRP